MTYVGKPQDFYSYRVLLVCTERDRNSMKWERISGHPNEHRQETADWNYSVPVHAIFHKEWCRRQPEAAEDYSQELKIKAVCLDGLWICLGSVICCFILFFYFRREVSIALVSVPSLFLGADGLFLSLLGFTGPWMEEDNGWRRITLRTLPSQDVDGSTPVTLSYLGLYFISIICPAKL